MNLPRDFSLTLHISAAATIFAVIFVLRCLYNLWWHPLRKIPGSRLAAMTGLYEFWYDVVLDGQYLFEIQKMHDKYGKMAKSPDSVRVFYHIFESHQVCHGG